jgi:hypothetical protein
MPYQFAREVLKMRALWGPKQPTLKITSQRFGATKITRLKKIYEHKKQKGVIASIKHGTAHPKSESVTLAYYPRSEHMPVFAMAASHTTAGAPGHMLPGSVGSIEFDELHRHGKTEIRINYMQAHFKTAFTQAEKDLHLDIVKHGNTRARTAVLPRALATKYGGWRNRLLQEIFSRAKAKKSEVVIFDYDPKRWESRAHSVNARIKVFTELAEKNGYAVEVAPATGIGMQGREIEIRATPKKSE